VATDLLSGEEVLLSEGDPVSAVLASSAIPAVLPPTRRDGRTLVDGGLADNAAISQAIALGADKIYVLPTGYACALPFPPNRPLAVAVQALSLLVQRRLITDVALYADRVGLVVLPPLCPLRISAIDFRHAAELCRRAHASSGDWLDSGAAHRPRPERILGMHGHETRPAGHDEHGASLSAGAGQAARWSPPGDGRAGGERRSDDGQPLQRRGRVDTCVRGREQEQRGGFFGAGRATGEVRRHRGELGVDRLPALGEEPFDVAVHQSEAVVAGQPRPWVGRQPRRSEAVG
jgi:hypothetical protein